MLKKDMNATINYGYKIMANYTTPDSITVSYHPYHDSYCSDYKYISYRTLKDTLTVKNVMNKPFAFNAEEKLEEYIYEHFDRCDILEMGTYIYQIIREKAYDIIIEILDEAKEDYIIDNEEQVVDVIIENIDFDSLYELVDDIVHAPQTMEEKLAEVGMSQKDFL